MACNHHNRDYLTPESSKGIYCRYCKIPLAKVIIPIQDRKKGTMQMLEGQDYLLESFERNFYYYKFVTFAKGEEMKKKEKEKDQVMEDKQQCNHNHLVVVTNGIQCHDCSHLLTVDIKDIHYWVFYDTAKKRDIMREYPSLTFREFSNYDLEEKKDINLINNQAQKIASLQAENKRLNKIVVGLSEMLINKTVGKSNNNTNMMLDIQTGGRE